MNAIILAGGKASRMEGIAKAFLKINHEPLIEKQIRGLKKLFDKIIIVTNLPARYASLKGVEVASDIIPYQGPLGGIYSGLRVSDSFYNFVVACDMPFIDTGLIEYMHKKCPGYDAVVPRIDNKYEPLFSFYSKGCVKFIIQLLDKKIFKISELFSRIKVKEITRDEVLKFAFGEKIFTNINTRKDLAHIYADRPL